ncbi:MAG: transposase family protein [Chloroflexi bacterium]|nr:transposase family protein [Chloroflexota bacterium]
MRGKRHAWELILVLIALGILLGESTPYGIGQWVAAHEGALLAWTCALWSRRDNR